MRSANSSLDEMPNASSKFTQHVRPVFLYSPIFRSLRSCLGQTQFALSLGSSFRSSKVTIWTSDAKTDHFEI